MAKNKKSIQEQQYFSFHEGLRSGAFRSLLLSNQEWSPLRFMSF